MTIEPRIDPWIDVDIPHRLVSNTEVWMWLEDTLGFTNYFWQDAPRGHVLHFRYEEDRMLFKLVYGV